MRATIIALATIFAALAGIRDDAHAGDLLGLQAGVSIGSQPPRPYYATRYYGSASVYAAPQYVPPHCYWAGGEPVWDGYRWIRPRVQVCE